MRWDRPPGLSPPRGISLYRVDGLVAIPRHSNHHEFQRRRPGILESMPFAEAKGNRVTLDDVGGLRLSPFAGDRHRAATRHHVVNFGDFPVHMGADVGAWRQ